MDCDDFVLKGKMVEYQAVYVDDVLGGQCAQLMQHFAGGVLCDDVACSTQVVFAQWDGLPLVA